MKQFERIGRFEVLDRIGGDAFSLLYSGNDPFEDRPVEIRICVASDDEFRWRFLKAAEDAFFLSHRNIARVLEFGSGEPKPYLVQEVFPGCPLKDRICSEDPVEDVVKLFYVLQVGQGLQYAHGQGVLHGQVSPEVIRVGEGERLKLGEFGIAQLASSWIQLQVGGAAYPSSGYILPEALTGLTPNHRSEVFGFGATAYEILTAWPPFSAETLPGLAHKVLNEAPAPVTSLWPECPEELERVIHKCLSLDPRRRYAGLDKVLEDLSAVLPISAEQAAEPSREIEPLQEDSQTVYNVDPESLSGSEPQPEDELKAKDLAPGPVKPGPLAVRSQALLGAVGRAKAALPSLREVEGRMRALLGAVGRAKAALPSLREIEGRMRALLGAVGRAKAALPSPREVEGRMRALLGAVGRAKAALPSLREVEGRMRALNWRWWPAAVALVFLFGAAGWGLAYRGREASSPAPASPVVTPSMPAANVEIGLLALDAEPWAEVTRILDDSGEAIPVAAPAMTPMALQLPAGHYKVVFVHPSADEAQECRVEVSSFRKADCRAHFASIETTDYFRSAGWWQ